MLIPKRVKHRKQFRGSMTGKAIHENRITNGSFGLIAQEPCWIRNNQIEATHVVLTRYTKRGGRVWIKIFPDKPVTVKPTETRIDSGKGSTEYWMAAIKPGRALFEVDDVVEADAGKALRLAMHKPPCKCKIAPKEEVNAGMDGVSAVTAEGDEQNENE